MGEARPCGLCGENDPAHFRIWFDDFVKLYKCQTCGFVEHHCGPGRPTVSYDYEHRDLLWFLERGQKFAHPEWRGLFEDTVARIRREVPSGKLLDVGCGCGQFLSLCAEAGYEVYGVEDNAGRAEYSAEVSGAEVKRAQYSTDLYPENTFDVISFIQVLEHMLVPKETLEAARYHLKPGGLLLVEVPSIRAPHFLAYQMTRMKRFVLTGSGVQQWHIGYYDHRTLQRMIEESGFESGTIVTGRWGPKYDGALGLIGRIFDPVFNAARIGGLMYMGRAKDARS